MGLAKKQRRQINTTSDSCNQSSVGGSIDGRAPQAGQSAGLLSHLVSRIFAKDAFLEAAQDGWGTTFRYAFLLLINRATAAGGIWIASDVAHSLRWF